VSPELILSIDGKVAVDPSRSTALLHRTLMTMRHDHRGRVSRSIGRLHLAQFLIDLQCFLVAVS
jgi:hypothetical protein